MPRMLLWEHRKRKTSRSCGLAQEGMAFQGLAEARSIDDQRLPGTNVLTISNESGTQWFGEITEFEQYRDLVDWASRSRDAGELLPVPKEFQRHTLHPFRKHAG
jgi:hypothetical protein